MDGIWSISDFKCELLRLCLCFLIANLWDSFLINWINFEDPSKSAMFSLKGGLSKWISSYFSFLFASHCFLALLTAFRGKSQRFVLKTFVISNPRDMDESYSLSSHLRLCSLSVSLQCACTNVTKSERCRFFESWTLAEYVLYSRLWGFWVSWTWATELFQTHARTLSHTHS